MDKFLDHKDELLAGRKIVSKTTVRQLVNQFLTSKKALVESGELSKRTIDDYYVTCERILLVFGKARPVESIGPFDFERLWTEFAKTHGPVRLSKDITCVRVLFNYDYESDLIEHPVKYVGLFDKPSKAVLRRNRKPRMFTATELRTVLDAAGTQLKAMIYLGLNCGFGNSDCAPLTLDAVDLKRGWINFPRPKTGIGRRIPLWPETVKLLKTVVADRPTPKTETPAPAEFSEFLNQIARRPDVADVRVQVTMFDAPERPFSDLVWVISSANPEEVMAWFDDVLRPDECRAGWPLGAAMERCPVPPHMHPVGCWWN